LRTEDYVNAITFLGRAFNDGHDQAMKIPIDYLYRKAFDKAQEHYRKQQFEQAETYCETLLHPVCFGGCLSPMQAGGVIKIICDLGLRARYFNDLEKTQHYFTLLLELLSTAKCQARLSDKQRCEIRYHLGLCAYAVKDMKKA